MRYGLILDTTRRPYAEILDAAQRAAEEGLDAIWCSQIFDYDALTLLAALAREVPGIGLGTAVVPVQPRHPVMLAAQALSVQALSDGRLRLGIGLSHQVVVEGVFGASFDRPVRYLREYLEILVPLLDGGSVSFQGEVLRASTLGPLEVPGAGRPPLLLAALGPRMVELAGSRADGTVTWMTGAGALASRITPALARAAAAAGRPRPQVVVGLPVCVTTDVAAARETAGRVFAIYGHLPSYRRVLDEEGAAGPGDVALVGDEEAVSAALERFAEAGATHFAAAPYGSAEERGRTLALLGALARAGARKDLRQTSGQG